MKTRSANYITAAGLEKLKAEYRQLKQDERPKVVAAVAFAAANGDRSENADYIYGKRRLREIDRRLGYLTRRLDEAQVVDPKTVKSASVLFGATVEVEDEDGEFKIYRIVGEDEIEAEKGWISWKSPIAKALMGKKVGDETLIRRPVGDLWVEIVKISYI